MSIAEIIEPTSIVLLLISLLWVLIDFFKDPGGSGVWMPSNKCTAFLAFSLFVLLASLGYTGNLSMGFWGLVVSLVLCLALLIISIIGGKKQQKGDEEEYEDPRIAEIAQNDKKMPIDMCFDILNEAELMPVHGHVITVLPKVGLMACLYAKAAIRYCKENNVDLDALLDVYEKEWEAEDEQT